MTHLPFITDPVSGVKVAPPLITIYYNIQCVVNTGVLHHNVNILYRGLPISAALLMSILLHSLMPVASLLNTW